MTEFEIKTMEGSPPPVRLWDVAHPYYAQEGNYYSNDCHFVHESWAEFMDAFGSSDPDLNLVYRWDWYVPDPEDYGPDEDLPAEAFKVFVVGQRKARLSSYEFPVRREDEPAIRAWLTERAKTMTAIWAPLDLGA